MAFVIANIELFAAFGVVASLLWLTFYADRFFGYSTTLPGDAVRLMNDGASVIDLRPASEFAAGHIAKAVNVVPEALPGWAGKQRKGKIGTVLLITGPRQSVIGPARLLRGLGFEPVHHLKGGMPGWVDAQLPQVK